MGKSGDNTKGMVVGEYTLELLPPVGDGASARLSRDRDPHGSSEKARRGARVTWAFILDSVEFTPAVVAGETSLGGSESSCLGLARALAARGHDIHLYTTKMDQAVAGTIDAAGVTWFDYGTFAQTNQFIEYDVVVALRVFAAFGQRPVNARLRLLWNQDLLVPGRHAGAGDVGGVGGRPVLLRLGVSPGAVGTAAARARRLRLGDAQRVRSVASAGGCAQRPEPDHPHLAAGTRTRADPADVAGAESPEARGDAADLPLLVDV
jgi:hypothetical protein